MPNALLDVKNNFVWQTKVLNDSYYLIPRQTGMQFCETSRLLITAVRGQRWGQKNDGL